MPQLRRPLVITAKANGRVADIRIEGAIFDFEASSARAIAAQLNAMRASGVRDAHVYIDSEGGSVIEAKRIVDHLRMLDGRITGVGGAMVASAATYIGLHLDEFLVRPATAYMVHKPQGMVVGNEDAVKAELKALEDITKEYRAAYAKKTGKTEDEIEALWGKGDRWYTGEEAVAEGFVDGLVDEDDEEEEDEGVNADVVAHIAACGCPRNKLPKVRARATNNTMDIKALCALLGMPETSTEAEVLARVNSLKKDNERHLQAAADLRKAEVKVILDRAIAERKLTEAHRASYESKFTASFDATKAEVEALTAAPEVAKEVASGKGGGATATGRDGWTYNDWMSKDEHGLRALITTDKAKFIALYEAHYGRKPELPA